MPSRIFFQSKHTQTHKQSLRGNLGACGSLQSRTRGIKNRDRYWIYKYGGGSENESLSGSLIRTPATLYNRTMMDIIQLKHNQGGEGNVNQSGAVVNREAYELFSFISSSRSSSSSRICFRNETVTVLKTLNCSYPIRYLIAVSRQRKVGAGGLSQKKTKCVSSSSAKR